MLKIAEYVNTRNIMVRGALDEYMKIFDAPLPKHYNEGKEVVVNDGFFMSKGEYNSDGKRIAYFEVSRIWPYEGGPYWCHLLIPAHYGVTTERFGIPNVETVIRNYKEDLRIDFMRHPESKKDLKWSTGLPAETQGDPIENWREAWTTGMRKSDVGMLYNLVREFLPEEDWEIRVKEEKTCL